MGVYDVTGPGVISTQNLVPAGNATANSAVEADVSAANTAAVRVSGTYTGVLSVQVTMDALPASSGSVAPVWETVGAGWVTPAASGTAAATIGSAAVGHFVVTNLGPFRRMRVTGLAAMTGAANVTITSIPYVF